MPYTGRVTGTWRNLKRNKLVTLPLRRDSGLSITGLTDAILVTMERWDFCTRQVRYFKKRRRQWPARSPDLSVCDYVVWGYLKSEVYLTKPRDILMS